MTTIDVTDKIERLEAIEELLGVSLESLSAFVEEGLFGYITLKVRGEIHPRNGTQLQQNTLLTATAFYPSRRIVGVPYRCACPRFSAEKFFGFQAFEIEFPLPLNQIAKVRVYPGKVRATLFG